jgi:hypothetical protein
MSHHGIIKKGASWIIIYVNETWCYKKVQVDLIVYVRMLHNVIKKCELCVYVSHGVITRCE